MDCNSRPISFNVVDILESCEINSFLVKKMFSLEMKATHVKKVWLGKWWNPLTWAKYGYLVENAVPIGFSMIRAGADSSFASAPPPPAPKYSKESKRIDRIKCFFFGHNPQMFTEQPERETDFYREYWDICRDCHKVLNVDQVQKCIDTKTLFVDGGRIG